MKDFLPMNKADMQKWGFSELDFICVTGDSYVDHPSFGISIISRVIENEGYRVGIIAQPDIKNPTFSFTRLPKPKYAYFVTSGNIDSMVAHYTVAKRPRTDDYYTVGGKTGKRPDRAVIAYTKAIKKIYPDIPVIIGGLEASLRRFAHYDYWDDKVRPSILIDSGADLLSYGMGEKQTVEIVNRLANGEDIESLTDIKGTCYVTEGEKIPFGIVNCPSFEQVCENKKLYAKACKQQMQEQDAVTGKPLLQKHGKKVLVQNAPMPPLNREELDKVYELPYMNYYHPSYEKDGGVPAIEEVEFSITHNRGCIGNCNFCSIAFHQGRYITSRSSESVLKQAEEMVKNPHFKGYIHDVGGPTANFRFPSCAKQDKEGLCRDKKCLAPTPCKAMRVDHSEYLELLRKLRAIKGVKKVFIRSGIRYDYVMADENDEFFKELVCHHISGQLKVAPEHCSANVLDKMGKPHIETYKAFQKKFYTLTKQAGKEQYLVPYLMSSHPGSTLKDAVELALFLKQNNIRPEQVQDFYPTPGTVSTCMYYTGIDPISGEEVYIPRTAEEKSMQRALLQYFKPNMYDKVASALKKAGRGDLIGNGENCLIKPPKKEYYKNPNQPVRKGGKPSARAKKGKK